MIGDTRNDVMDRDEVAWAEDLLDRVFPDHKINRILLVNPPDADAALFQFATANRGRYTNYPPYGLAVLAEKLRNRNVDVRLCNLNHEVLRSARAADDESDFDFNKTWQSALDHSIEDFSPDLVGVTCMFTMTHASFKQTCQHAARSGVPLAIGGVHVSNDVNRVLDDITDASFAFVREADVAFPLFVDVIRGVLPVTELGQVIFREGDRRQAFDRNCQPTVDDLNVIPAYDLTEMPEYADHGVVGAFYCFKPQGTKFATVLSNRGCRAQCTFCSVRNFNGVGVRQRSVTSVVDELELLENEYGIGHVMWLDDDLLKDHDRAIELFNEKVRRGLKLTWDATNGVIASSCTDDVIAAAAESGCIAINIGMESGNRQILRDVKKPGTLETFLAAAEVLRQYEQIHASVFLMLGFPGETLAMIEDSIDVARQMDLDWYRISPLTPLPNTPIYDSMVAQGLIQKVGCDEVRFMGGAYGKQPEIERGGRLAAVSFRDAFENIPRDAIPTPAQITDIWFYMNYHLNFHRLFDEKRPEKIEQQFAHLRTLSDIIAPENGFALYFLGYLQHKTFGTIDPDIVARLDRRVTTSEYWRDRLDAFCLSVEHLRNTTFPNEQARKPFGLGRASVSIKSGEFVTAQTATSVEAVRRRLRSSGGRRLGVA